MALHNQILLVISLSFLVFQLNNATPAPAPSPIGISYISSSPNGSPSPAPSPQAFDQFPAADVSSKSSVNHYVDSLMQSSISKAEEFIGDVVEKRLSDPSVDPYSKDCLLVCKEVYESAVDAMAKTIVDIDQGSYYTANVDLSAVSTDLDTCNDCIKEVYGEDQEFMKFDEWASNICNDALEKIVGFSS